MKFEDLLSQAHALAPSEKADLVRELLAGQTSIVISSSDPELIQAILEAIASLICKR